MKSNEYIPYEGDIIWLSLDPTLGSEPGGRRPALVLSHSNFNRNGMVVICPITSKVKGLRFEVLTRNCDEVNGAILSSQMKCLDWRKRNPQFIEKCPQNIITVVRLKIALLLGIDQSLLDLLG